MYRYKVGNTRKTGYAKTRKDAEEKLAEAQVMAGRGEMSEINLAFSEWSDLWLRTKHIGDRTRVNYKNDLGHLCRFIGDTGLAKITPQQLDSAYTELLKEGLSPTTVNSIHRTARGCLKSAWKKGLLFRDVAALAEPPSPTKRKPYVLSRREWTQLIRASRSESDGLLIELLLKTGIRVDSEALSLTWGQIDWERSELTVWESKTEAGENRTIPLDAELVSRLKGRYVQHSEKQLATGKVWNPNDFVFITTNGNRHSLSNLRRRLFKRLKAVAGLPESLRFHDLRHNCGSYLIAERLSIATVSQIMGHANPAITMSIYVHELVEDRDEVREAMARINLAV